MSIYAEVHIVLKDGRKFGTWDITQGFIRDVVLDVVEQCVPSETLYGSVTVQGGTTLLQETVEVFKGEVKFKFDVCVANNLGDYETFKVEEHNFNRLKEYLKSGNLTLVGIEQDEYSTAFIPSWVEDVLGIDFDYEPGIDVFLGYCDSFLNGKIFFGVPVDEISSITLKLS